ncbi:MAG: pyridoxal-dependent decarboxylase [Gemmatimonadaceae bacterium]
MNSPPHTDIPPVEFARAAHEMVDWIAGYLTDPERYPVLSRATPGSVRTALPPSPPMAAEPLRRIVDDFESTLLPGITHWNHPGFFAYFAISSSGPGILGELLSAALNVNGMLWTTSPAATELEQLTLDWLRQMLGMEPGWFGLITDTASMSTLLALAAAREARSGLAVRERGLAGRADIPTLRVYASEHAHSSVDKAAITLGLGHANVVKVPCDESFRMRADVLAELARRDRADGHLPLAVVATVGTTSTTSIDPVPAIADICAREGMWLHVDGAYGGMAAICGEMRGTLAGVERADSLVVNPHKWLFTPIDCSVLYTRRPELLESAFTLVPEYLTTTSGAGTVNYMDYGVQLGRRFRALKLWMVIRAFGVDGLAARIREHCRLARDFAGWVAEERAEGWTLAAPVTMSVVCFRFSPPDLSPAAADAVNERILADVNATGEIYISHTRLHGRYVLRLAVGNIRTEQHHVERAWALLREAARRSTMSGGGSPATR